MATYTPPTIANYNDNPPTNDGSTNFTDNGVDWNRHIDEIGDPIKSYVDAINSETSSSFGRVEAKYVVSAKDSDYGAVGDGATDDTSAFTLIEADNSVTFIYVPEGKYIVTGISLDKVYLGPGKIILDGTPRAEVLTRVATPPDNTYDADADGEQFFTGDSILGNQKKVNMTADARVETFYGTEASTYVYPYELFPEFLHVQNGGGTYDGSGTTTPTTLGAGSSEISVDPQYVRTITNITVATNPVVTVGAHNFTTAGKVHIYDVVGTMEDVLNNRFHSISAVAATTITIDTATTGLTYTSGGTASRKTNRTGLVGKRVFVDHWGYGDMAAYNAFARVNTEVEDDSFINSNAAILWNGDVQALANGAYCNPVEYTIRDGNGADVAAVGIVMNFTRTVENNPDFGGTNQPNGYSNKDCVWLGIRPQNKSSSVYCDSMYNGTGLWRVGLDFTATTFADMKAAVAIKADDRVFYNATAIENAEKSNVKWFATGNIDNANSCYTAFDSATSTWQVVYKNNATLQVGDTGLIVDGFVNLNDRIQFTEISDPTTPSADSCRLYARDNGGKTELVVIMPDGNVTQLAIEV